MSRAKNIVWMWSIFSVVMPLAVFAGEVVLPKTGQTTCYDTAGNVIDCTGTGQDGDVQAGVAWPEPRFEDNGDGTITDHLTGLIWLKDANRFGLRTWSDALNDCNTLAADGVTLTDGSAAGDWHLPNVLELESLINAEQSSSAAWLNSQGFINVQSDFYWSATTYQSHPYYAWGVNMHTVNGDLMGVVKAQADNYGWPVRRVIADAHPAHTWFTGQTTCYDPAGSVIACEKTGQDGDIQAGVSWPVPRFEDNGDGTVTDHLTGLIWLKNARRFLPKSWSQAAITCSRFSSGGDLKDGSVAGEWRLPNRKEMLSLVDFSQQAPILPQGHPFLNVPSDFCLFWTATTNAASDDRAWVLFTLYGELRDYSKSRGNYLWPVRGGQGDGDSCVFLGGDADRDGICGDNDDCPNDPGKIEPGVCGCGRPDTDSDGDGTLDCDDLCPNDPNKIAPGVCGCNNPDTDTDDDTIADCVDNCPAIANPDQMDTDGNGIGDACETQQAQVFIEEVIIARANGTPVDDYAEFGKYEPVRMILRYTITDNIIDLYRCKTIARIKAFGHTEEEIKSPRPLPGTYDLETAWLPKGTGAKKIRFILKVNKGGQTLINEVIERWVTVLPQ